MCASLSTLKTKEEIQKAKKDTHLCQNILTALLIPS